MTTERAHFLDAASRIGRRLCRDAVWHEGRCNWLGWAMEPHGGQWISVYRAMGVSVYDGAAGIGLFLAYLAQLNDDEVIATTAVGALAQALSAVEDLSAAGEYGFYSGLSGIALSCVRAGTALGREDLIERGRAALLACATIAPKADRLDIINGSAGLIPALIEADERFGRDEFVDAAVRHGEHLVGLAARTERGWSWDTFGAPDEPHLLGFAHGASGVAYALGLLSRATGRREFLDAASEGLRYERAHFRASQGNWPDLRSFVQPGPTGEPGCMLAWCHGAPGIGFARLALHTLFPDDASILSEAETAVRTTAATWDRPRPEPAISRFVTATGKRRSPCSGGRCAVAPGAAARGRERRSPGARSVRGRASALALRRSWRGGIAKPLARPCRNWIFLSSPVRFRGHPERPVALRQETGAGSRDGERQATAPVVT